MECVGQIDAFIIFVGFAEERLLKAIGTEEYDVSGPPSSLTDPDVQISRFRFFMEEFRSRRCTDGRSGLPAAGDAVGVQRTGSWGTAP